MTLATGTSKAAEPIKLRWDPDSIPPFPAIALKALKLMSGTDTSLLELCNLIRSDLAFSIAILRIANSPLVAFPKNVTSVLQASMLLGFQRLFPRSASEVLAQVDGHPLLTVGNYGRGRCAAFASDIGPHWAPTAFTQWEGFARLWSQTISWLASGDNGAENTAAAAYVALETR